MKNRKLSFWKCTSKMKSVYLVIKWNGNVMDKSFWEVFSYLFVLASPHQMMH